MKKLLLLLLISTTAQAEWVDMEFPDGSMVATENTQGERLAYACPNDGECLYTMIISCTEGVKTTLLLLTEKASLPVTSICAGNDVLFWYADPDLNKLFDQGDNVAIAIPHKGLKFRVHRFDLKGSRAAREYAEAETNQAVKVSEEWL